MGELSYGTSEAFASESCPEGLWGYGFRLSGFWVRVSASRLRFSGIWFQGLGF